MSKTLYSALLLLLMSSAAHAGTTTSNMNVSATVTTSCSMSAGALAFGNYDTVTGTAVNGTATLSVSCTKGASTVIALGQGAAAATGSTDADPLRRMSNGANRLSYSLFQDAARLTVWGNTSLTGAPYVSTSSVPSSITVYGTIAASQDVVAGSYSDTVVATITF